MFVDDSTSEPTGVGGKGVCMTHPSSSRGTCTSFRMALSTPEMIRWGKHTPGAVYADWLARGEGKLDVATSVDFSGMVAQNFQNHSGKLRTRGTSAPNACH